jgi:hypothetical protein
VMFKPYRLVGKRDVSSVRSKLSDLIGFWSKDWLGVSGSVSVEMISSYPEEEMLFEQEGVELYQADDEKWCMLAGTDFIRNNWDSAFFHVSERHASQTRLERSFLGPQIAMKAFSNLAARLLGKENQVDTRPDREHLTQLLSKSKTPGIEGAVAIFSFAETSFRLIWSADIVLGYLENNSIQNNEITKKNIVPIKNGLARQKLSATVYLGSTELSLEDMANLNVGDVIRLDQKVSDLPKFVIDGNKVSFSGYLGKQEDIKAFKLHDADALVEN